MAARDHAAGAVSRVSERAPPSRHAVGAPFFSSSPEQNSGSSGCSMGLFHCVSALPPPNHFLVAPFHRSPKLIPHSHPPFSQNISQNKSPRGSARSGCGRHLLISGARPDDPCGSQPTREEKSSPLLRTIPCRRVGGYTGMRWQRQTDDCPKVWNKQTQPAAAAAGP